MRPELPVESGDLDSTRLGHAADEGGDAACWLAQVCPDCGALNEDPTAVCWRCGKDGAAAARTTD
jgi:uncharacterized OB-fold protein